MPPSIKGTLGNTGSDSSLLCQRSYFSQIIFCSVCASAALAMPDAVNAVRPGKGPECSPTSASIIWLSAGSQEQRRWLPPGLLPGIAQAQFASAKNHFVTPGVAPSPPSPPAPCAGGPSHLILSALFPQLPAC